MEIIQTYNQIAPEGLMLFEKEKYCIETNAKNPSAILCRSQNLQNCTIPNSVKVIARAGAGTNNIPVTKCTELGIPVLNTPGANANAVKELVLAGMLLACRHICNAWHYTQTLDKSDRELPKKVEAYKKQFAGFELPGKTLAVIGLGKIGVKVANAANDLDMSVIGYDPAITVQNAWELNSTVKQAQSLDEAIQTADFITVHVPLNTKTRHLFSRDVLYKTKKGAILLNFARDGIVDNAALACALTSEQISQYVCDFPHPDLLNSPNVICLPHLGASTKEAESNCAKMAVSQIKLFLEQGHIKHSVNFPTISLSKIEGYRLLVINKNVPNMVAQISSILSAAKLNIIDMINKSRDDIACTLLDINHSITDEIIQQLLKIDGVIRARMCP